MAGSTVLLAKRALVKLLLQLAVAYNVVVSVNRDSDNAKVTAAFRKIVLKVHPDKGGKLEDSQALQSAKSVWDKALRDATSNQKKGRAKEAHNEGGRRAPKQSGDTIAADLADPAQAKKQYRIQSYFVLLTYHGFADLDEWRRFCDHVADNLGAWGVKHWCATLEATKKGKLHVHCALQFTRKVDRCSRFFTFEGHCPRADMEDILGDGLNRKKMQISINRMMFYCFADKVGTQRDEQGEICVAGNYFPCWEERDTFTYPVPGRWPEGLWKARKLTHSTYESYLFLCRDGVPTRKRNLEAVREREEADLEQKEMEAVVQRIRQTFHFPVHPEADAWLAGFLEEKDRYPFLLLLGPSRAGKTEYAKSLFKSPLELKVGTLEQLPDGLRAFDRKRHDGIVLDDVRDFGFLVRHQEKLQSKYDVRLELGTTPGGQCTYHKWLWRVPLVVTANYSTTGRELLDTDDFLGNLGNRTLLQL